ncbi:MAG: four helix bundle protein [Chloroflexi bacterium]|nr:four helix bundle protein [Chloroflexota bacterium]
MATAKRFDELHVWQTSRVLVKNIYQSTWEAPFSHDFGLKNQIQRAAVSIMSNIAEGFHAGSNTEFLRFLKYARRSLAEVQSQLYTALDLAYISQANFNHLFSQTETTFRQLNAFIAYLRSHTSEKSIKESSATYKTTSDNTKMTTVNIPNEFLQLNKRNQ